MAESFCKSLSLVEFKISVFKNIATEKFSVVEVKELFTFMDTNKNGRLERDEFIAGIRVSIQSLIVVTSVLEILS